MKYSVIYADPPWKYSNKSLNKGGAERHYPTMKTADIEALPVAEMADENAILFLWGTWPTLPDSLRVIAAWGFTYKTVGFNWIKTSKKGGLMWGLGSYTRANSEFCLIATKGKPAIKSHAVHSVVMAPMREHSRKPDQVRDMIVELCGDVPRVELFARTTADGWDVWGNETEKFGKMAL